MSRKEAEIFSDLLISSRVKTHRALLNYFSLMKAMEIVKFR